MRNPGRLPYDPDSDSTVVGVAAGGAPGASADVPIGPPERVLSIERMKTHQLVEFIGRLQASHGNCSHGRKVVVGRTLGVGLGVRARLRTQKVEMVLQNLVCCFQVTRCWVVGC